VKIALGMDHRGAELRGRIVDHLQQRGHEILDFGADSSASVDYPDYAAKAARAVAAGEADLGILVCGTGIGMSIAANKVRGIRCAVCTDATGATMARRHNDANVLALRATEMDPAVNLALIDIFLTTPFEGGRHQKRVEKIAELECS
jgi:ribose 5-phosphate isomerase B